LLLPYLKKFSTKLVQNLPNEVVHFKNINGFFPEAKRIRKSTDLIRHEYRYGSLTGVTALKPLGYLAQI